LNVAVSVLTEKLMITHRVSNDTKKCVAVAVLINNRASGSGWVAVGGTVGKRGSRRFEWW
jgi:hypothetical protein